MAEEATFTLLLEPGQVPLITREELGIWAQTEIALDDAYATEVINSASALVAGEARHIDWLEPDSGVTAPFDAWMICILVARRTYVNPDGEVRSQIGPLGATVLDIRALGMQLSQEEKDKLREFRPTTEGQVGSLWTLRMTGGGPILQTVHVSDDSGTDWMIPYQDPNDVASELNP